MSILSLQILLSLVLSISAHRPHRHSHHHERHHLERSRKVCAKQSMSCILAAEATEGPYYIDRPMIRSDLVEDRTGLPLELEIEVIDVTTCKPVEGSYVDIWSADANGQYSGWSEYAENAPILAFPPFGHIAPIGRGPMEESRWLRGVQVSDHEGKVKFQTLMPAWYQGRTTHIHVRIHSGNVSVDEGILLSPGRISHTGQFFFEDELVSHLAAEVEPYKTRALTLPPKFNGKDWIYRDSDGSHQTVSTKFPSEDGQRLIGQITIGIDPTADRKERHGPHGRFPPPLLHAFTLTLVCTSLVVAIYLAKRLRSKRTHNAFSEKGPIAI